ncbi:MULTISPECIES: MarR family winged helix-turn-helix transcriptional regulator [Thermomonosporaceae]|uniref:MarR family winged helix-turn-helix transcriptional regulator n=1 Tax=Thermomonosporaceae TaxID=2012 RepID=UPI00255B20A7|nr:MULTISPECIES: MarR family transcriptional regulator [Thermomonosporaceae]MDL4774144.1 MarR family transcriptional regulator [Actinomadura xylanilytica]
MANQADAPPPTGYLLWHVSLRWRVAMDRTLAPLGLTHAQYAVVASLHAMVTGGVRPSQRQLAEYSGLEPMYISRLVRALERAGLVERTDNPDDPRAVQLALTPRGSEVVMDAVPEVRELEERYLEPLGGRDSARNVELRRALQTLLAHADTLGGTPAPAAFGRADG